MFSRLGRFLDGTFWLRAFWLLGLFDWGFLTGGQLLGLFGLGPLVGLDDPFVGAFLGGIVS